MKQMDLLNKSSAKKEAPLKEPEAEPIEEIKVEEPTDSSIEEVVPEAPVEPKVEEPETPELSEPKVEEPETPELSEPPRKSWKVEVEIEPDVRARLKLAAQVSGEGQAKYLGNILSSHDTDAEISALVARKAELVNEISKIDKLLDPLNS